MLGTLDGSVPATLETDTCIVGGGPAGITLALELGRRGRDVILAEGGALEFESDSQEIYRGTVEGDPYYDLEIARLRYLGGSSNHWTGIVRELDEEDFLPKRAAPDRTAWPIRRRDLDPYLAPAYGYLRSDSRVGDVPINDDFVATPFRYTNPVHFGNFYQQELSSSPKIRTLLNANLVGIELDQGKVVSVEFRNYGTGNVRIKARNVVLACGGIENSRLLLHFNRRTGNRLGNEGDTVGRYWMEHPHLSIGEFVVLDERFVAFVETTERAEVGPSAAFMDREGTLNAQIKLYSSPYAGAKKIIADLLCVAPSLARVVGATFKRDLRCAGKMRASWEQEPLASNRIVLDAPTDRFGMAHSKLQYRKSPLDRHTITKFGMAYTTWLVENDIARVKIDPWLLDPSLPYPDNDSFGGWHHMGGTRMADTVAKGVVDQNLRVFGTDNLFVAGSSVFPSSGHANPTLSILQLSLRLADHLIGEKA